MFIFMVFGLCFFDFGFSRVLNPIQRGRTECLTVEEGSKLSERSEFLAPPQANAEGGKPKAKIVGGLSFASFSLAAKENEGTYVSTNIYMFTHRFCR